MFLIILRLTCLGKKYNPPCQRIQMTCFRKKSARFSAIASISRICLNDNRIAFRNNRPGEENVGDPLGILLAEGAIYSY